ncbi:MAG: hypothetical protein P1U57_02760 [Oleibacter sp.]|nr:hypothetical protein [Thalassolituus sp.]
MNYTAALFSTLLTCATSLAGIYTFLPLVGSSSIFSHNHSFSANYSLTQSYLPHSKDEAQSVVSHSEAFIIDTLGLTQLDPKQHTSSDNASYPDTSHAMLSYPMISYQGDISSLKLDHNHPHLLRQDQFFIPIVSI